MHSSSIKQIKILLIFFACNCSAALANGLSFSTATDFTTGNYGGASSTDIWYVPFTARYDKDRASFRVIIPYLNITGPGNVLGPGIGGIDGSGTLIGGGFVGGGSSGGGIFVCDEKNDDCPNSTSGRGENNSGSGGSGSGSGDGGSGGGDDDRGGDDDHGAGGSGGSDDSGGGSGSSGSDDDGGNGSSGHGGSGSGSSGGDVDSSGGSDDDSEDVVNKNRQKNISTLGLTGGIPLGGSSLARSTQSGLGDIITAFSYNLIDHAPTGIVFDITARLKIPTASASQNLGSGQVDYAVQGDLFKTMSKFIFNATFGYRILGNPSGITFHNVLYGAAGAGYRLSPDLTIGTSFNIGQSPVRLQDSRDLTLYLSHRVSDRFRLNIYGLRGFSERSPDWGGGLNLRYIF